MRAVLSGIVATGDVIGQDADGRTVLAVAVEDWLLDALADLDAGAEDLEVVELLEARGGITGRVARSRRLRRAPGAARARRGRRIHP